MNEPEHPNALSKLYAAFRSDLIDAVGHCGTYDALAILGHLSGRSGYLPGMGDDQDHWLAQRTIELAVVCVTDEQGDGAIELTTSAGDIVSEWVDQTIAEIETAQAEGHICWAEALKSRA